MSCPCDQKDFPPPLRIHAGLRRIPRALAMFPEWRLAILDGIGRQPALKHWRARGEDDFGVMLVEMGAYLFDVLSFYDEVICNDSYLQTTGLARESSANRLVELLGYVPRPAISSQVWLAAEADGKRLVELPARTAFRSGEYDGNPPEVFELESNAWLDPRLNKHTVSRVLDDAISAGATLDTLLVTPNSLRIRQGMPVVLSFDGTLRADYIESIQSISLSSKRPATKVTLANGVTVPAGAEYSALRIFTLGNTTTLWQAGDPFSGANVLLDTRVPIRAGEIVLFEKEGDLEVRKVSSAESVLQTLIPGASTTVKDTDGDITAELEGPDIKTSVSRLDIGSSLGWSSSARDRITLFYGVADAADVLIPERDNLQQGDSLHLSSDVDPARVPVEHLLLEDVHQEGVHVRGSLDAGTGSASVDTSPAWGKTLHAPVTLFGNVVKASRGESVRDELLGTGDATRPWQTFQLSKKPLTYLPAENAAGFASTLEVYVGGVRWEPVSSFFGVSDDARVYTVRHDEEGNTYIRFGGGARLPSGTTVYANYRFGAGASVPPAGSITQLARPVAGLKTVRNVLPAFGGGDAESAEDIKYYAPDAALLLGRAISLVDLEAAARGITGVEAVKAVFRWDKQRFEKRAVIYFIGDAQMTADILASLQSLGEPDAAIDVKPAQQQSATLHLDVEMDHHRRPDDVIKAIREALYRKPAPGVPGGLLHRARLGPEGAVLHSHVIEAVMAVDGVTGIKQLTLNGAPITGYGVSPAAGHYFDFGEAGTATGGITINGVN